MDGTRWNRRQFLGRAATAGAGLAVAAGSAYVGYRWPRSGGTASAESSADVQNFVSRPDLRPPALAVTRPTQARSPLVPRHLLLAPKGYAEEGPGQQGTMIVDTDGQLVWFLPTFGADQVPMNFKVQRYRGQQVLTWWQGAIADGRGDGVGLIYDSSYRQLATVRVSDGLRTDLHEFLLTDHGTALLSAYEPVQADLSALGGPSSGWVLQGVVQEVDVESGQVVFDWRSLDHVGIEETYQPLEGDGTRKRPFDYLHLNSIDAAPDGDLVISARNTCALYRLSRAGGAVVWRLGGRRSDFGLGPGARFWWQHDARVLGPDRLSLFDDASSPPKERESRGLILKLDHAGGRATVERQYRHPARLLADNQGSMQSLPGGRTLVGWGSQPYTSIFSRSGRLLLDARLPINDQSYRAFAADWTGGPLEPPTVAVGPNSARGVTVYASWNGATEVRHWQVLAGPTSSSMKTVAIVPRSGFETTAVVDAEGPYFGAIALGARREPLGQATPIRSKP
jgi:Arylsulfotransferase (ASST)